MNKLTKKEIEQVKLELKLKRKQKYFDKEKNKKEYFKSKIPSKKEKEEKVPTKKLKITKLPISSTYLKYQKKKKTNPEIFKISKSKKPFFQTIQIVAEEYRKKLIKNKTNAEKKCIEYLKELNINFIFQHVVFYSAYKFYITDFYLPKHGLLLELDGQHHYKQENLVKDKLRTKHLENLNYKVLRFDNKEIYNKKNCLEKLNKYIVK